MNATKLQLKLFIEGTRPPLDDFIPVFHRWVKEHSLPELLIDVANYTHVPRGPGVALIGHATDYFLEEGQGRAGLLTSRKRDPVAETHRLDDLVRRALQAALLLQNDPQLQGKLKFRTDEFLFRINDRLLAPPGEATYAVIRPFLEGAAARLWADAPCKLIPGTEPRELFSVTLRPERPLDLASLLKRL